MPGDDTGQSPAGLLTWRIVLRSGEVRGAHLPTTLITRSGAFRHENLPEEVAMLLPAGDGPTTVIDKVVDRPEIVRDTLLGLFLAGPLINIDVEARRLWCAGVRWIANVPSVCQQDEEFTVQLVDVGLDVQRELRQLARFRALGFCVAAAVGSAGEALEAVAIDAGLLIVLPRIADFAAGFPSLRQRASAVQSVHDAVREAGWHGPLLALGEDRDAARERLWPPRADGLLCRPTRQGPDRRTAAVANPGTPDPGRGPRAR